MTDIAALLILKQVLKYQDSFDRVFHALGDRTRRAMVERLVRGAASMTELAGAFEMSLPAISQHLSVLETAGIISSTKLGRIRTYQLVPDALAPATEWITRQRHPIERRLDALGTFLAKNTNQETNP